MDVFNTYQRWMSLKDPRVVDWPLMSSPWPTAAICVLYVIVMNVGPRVLKGRAFPVQWLVLAYNLAMVGLNLWMAAEMVITTMSHYTWLSCQPVDYSESEQGLRIARVLWWFYISKVVEMLDSTMFMLRGKYNQLSFLHIYHHSSMFALWWIGTAFVAGGVSVQPALINASVHVIMYTYYFLAALGPHMQKYLWWKAHLTKLQMIQFFGALFQMVYLINTNDCNFPSWMIKTNIAYQISFIFLFGNFYIQSYMTKKPSSKKSSNGIKKD